MNDQMDGGEMHDDAMRDALDDAMDTAARGYHAPPVTPREDMWAVISARLAAGDRGAPDEGPALAADECSLAPVVAPLSVVRGRASHGAARRHPVPRGVAGWPRGVIGIAAAAALLLATGIVVGRRWPATTAAPTAAPTVATSSAPSTMPTGAPALARVADATTGAAAPRATSPRPTGSVEPATTAGDRSAGGRAATVSPYAVATVRHLAAVEALLVTWRTDSATASTDARVGTWSRSLLQDTRLLLDSPAGDDPRRRRLLEDLELVLVQMAQLAPASGRPAGAVSDATERALIDGTLRHAQLLPRLRSAVPAGSATSGT